MNNLRRFLVYAFLFASVTFTSYIIIEFTLRDTLVAWGFAGSGVPISSVLLGFASTMLVSIILGLVITFYVYRNEEKVLSTLRIR
jgi:hypothetical protein